MADESMESTNEPGRSEWLAETPTFPEKPVVLEPEPPALAESVIALGLIVIAGAGCWMLYGGQIRQMLAIIGRIISK